MNLVTVLIIIIAILAIALIITVAMLVSEKNANKKSSQQLSWYNMSSRWHID